MSYSFGSYVGHNTFDLHTDTAGTYILECEAPQQFVIAIGSGIGTRIAITVVSAVVPVLLGMLTFVLVLVLRWNQKRTARYQPHVAPPLA